MILRLPFIVALAAATVTHVLARTAGDNCVPQWSQRGACDDDSLACGPAEGEEGLGFDKCMPAGKKGDKCSLGNQCGRGLKCDGKKCAKAGGVGDACGSYWECGAEFHCAGDTGTCQPLLKKGATCSGLTDCEDGLYCSRKVCVSRGGKKASCLNQLDCETGLACMQKKCIALPQLGERCDSIHDTSEIGGVVIATLSNCVADLDCNRRQKACERREKPRKKKGGPSPNLIAIFCSLAAALLVLAAVTWICYRRYQTGKFARNLPNGHNFMPDRDDAPDSVFV